MDFGEAFRNLKNGLRVARGEWQGKRWVALGGTPVVLEADKFWNRHTRAFAKAQPGETAVVNPYLVEKTAKDAVQMGWAPTQEDILADDWSIVA